MLGCGVLRGWGRRWGKLCLLRYIPISFCNIIEFWYLADVLAVKAALFMRNMLVKLQPGEQVSSARLSSLRASLVAGIFCEPPGFFFVRPEWQDSFSPDLVIFNAGGFPANRYVEGMVHDEVRTRAASAPADSCVHAGLCACVRAVRMRPG